MGFRQVYIVSRSRCSYEGGYLVVTSEEATTKIHLSEIASITLGSPRMYVSAYLLSELAKSKIPVVICDEKSYPIAEALPLYGTHNCARRVIEQLEWTLPSKKRLWQKIVRHKIHAQSEVLSMHGEDDRARVLLSYAADVRSGDPTNREAASASLYFPALFGAGFSREQDTYVNAGLNYGYSILLSKVSREIVARGYLTQLGIHHHSELNQWNLSCDLMEPFRPFVDNVVAMSGIQGFTKEMRLMLVDIMNRIVLYRDGQYKLGSVISQYVKECFSVLSRELPLEDLESYSQL